MYDEETKQRAYQLDPECWESYSGMHKAVKRYRETRRVASLKKADEEISKARASAQTSYENQLKPGTKWRHRNGNVYEVILVTNLASTREEYQPQVVYKGENGNVWSRPVSDWGRSFTLQLQPTTECGGIVERN